MKGINKLYCKKKYPVITLDGLAGTGKSALSCCLAKELGWNLLPSGMLYRYIAYIKQRDNKNIKDIIDNYEINEYIKNISFSISPSDTLKVIVDSEDLTDVLKDEEVGFNAAKIAQIQEVRDFLISVQQSFYKAPGLIAEGRDMSSVVFPDADLKIILEADMAIRAARRFKELQKEEKCASITKVANSIESRDKKDIARVAIERENQDNILFIDNSHITIEDTVDLVMRRLKKLRVILDINRG